MLTINKIYTSAQNADYVRLKPRKAHLHGLGAVHIAIPVECLRFEYDRYINLKTGAVVLIPREEEHND